MPRIAKKVVVLTLTAALGALAAWAENQAGNTRLTVVSPMMAPLFLLTAVVTGGVFAYRARTRRTRTDSNSEHVRTLEARLRLKTSALEAAANAIVICDREGRIVWVNTAFSQLTGYSADEVLGKSPRVLKSAVHDESFYKTLWGTIAAGNVWQGEIVNRRKDGCLYTEEMTITPVRSAQGDITHFIAIKVDVTQRRQADVALQRSEASLSSMVKNAPYGIYRCTPDGKLLKANPAMCRILGYQSESELKSVNLKSVYYNPLQRQSVVESLLSTGSVHNLEHIWVRKSGHLIIVRINAHLSSEAADGESVIEGYVEDITESRRAELEIHRVNRALSTLNRCNEALIRASAEHKLLQEICDILVEVGGYRLAWVGYKVEEENKSVRWMAKAGVDEGYSTSAQLTWADEERGRGPVGTAIRTGELCLFRDIVQNPRFSPWREEAIERGYASVISLPLIADRAVIGSLNIYSHEADAFDESEIELLNNLSRNLSFGIVSVRNSSERDRAERALRDSEERYRFLFARNPHPMWVCDVNTRAFLEVNDAAVERYGYSREAFLSMRLDEIVPPEDLPALHQRFSTAQLGYAFSNTARHRKKNGKAIDVEISAYRFLQDQQPVVLALAYDVTERIRAERELLASEQRYRVLFEQNLAAVFHASDGKLLDCNEAMYKMLGYTRQEILALDFTELYCDQGARNKGRELLLSAGRLTNYQVDLRKKDGSTITVLANLNLLDAKEGDVPVFAGVMLDVTEPKKLQEQLLQSQKLEALGKLTGGIAHDFNNILMIINSYGELILDQLEQSSPLRGPMEQICAAGTRAASLTRQLLAFSRKQVMSTTVIDLDELLQGMKEMLHRLLGEDVSVTVERPEVLWPIEADPSQIEQVVLNLAVNARDAMPKGGHLSIKTANVVLGEEFVAAHPGSSLGEYVALTVSDTGHGIGPEIRSKVFEPFFTTKDAGKGTGLGLSTVYGIIKQSGGCITLETEEGQGTTFYLYFRRSYRPSKKRITVAKRPQSCANSGARILLVEDETPTREAIASFLIQNGFQVIAASNGEDALRVCDSTRSGGIDLLLTDVVMPGMNGVDLAAAFQQRYPASSVVFMSGYTDDVILRSGLAQAEYVLLSKPFLLSDLAGMLRERLAKCDQSDS